MSMCIYFPVLESVKFPKQEPVEEVIHWAARNVGQMA